MTRHTCRTCNTQVATITDDHGITRTIDLAALTIIGEALAVLAGRATIARVPNRRSADDWWLRNRWTIGKPHLGTLHTEHTCQPVPDAWRVPPAPPTAPQTIEPEF